MIVRAARYCQTCGKGIKLTKFGFVHLSRNEKHPALWGLSSNGKTVDLHSSVKGSIPLVSTILRFKCINLREFRKIRNFTTVVRPEK